MTVYPELAFQLMILRNYMDEIIRPSRANQRCAIGGQLNSARYCGAATFKAKYSRQLWNWMAQLLVVSLKFDQIEKNESNYLKCEITFWIENIVFRLLEQNVQTTKILSLLETGVFFVRKLTVTLLIPSTFTRSSEKQVVMSKKSRIPKMKSTTIGNRNTS